jgi:hypothetical protein
MIDVSETSDEHSGRTRVLPKSLVQSVARQYKDWRTGRYPSTDNAAVASFDELALNDFVIAPSRYLALSQPSVTFSEAIKRRSELASNFNHLILASKDADDELAQILEVRR